MKNNVSNMSPLNIKVLMLKSHVTQAEIARKLGITIQTAEPGDSQAVQLTSCASGGCGSDGEGCPGYLADRLSLRRGTLETRETLRGRLQEKSDGLKSADKF